MSIISYFLCTECGSAIFSTVKEDSDYLNNFISKYLVTSRNKCHLTFSQDTKFLCIGFKSTYQNNPWHVKSQIIIIDEKK